ncbi:MAG: hypothetical protein HOC23_10765 [Halieaceae bacterium]|nr:hypothetical protein [Halieaceae bacterium]
MRVFRVNHLAVLFAVIAIGFSSLANAGRAQEFTPFPETDSYAGVFAQMNAARKRAVASDKLLMYVMGANWCHDSLAFVRMMGNPEIAALLDKNYEVLLINVGYFEYIRDIITRYGEPIVYGTPTVLVVEPESDALLNRATLPFWRNADVISLDQSRAYFEAFSPGQQPPPKGIRSAVLAQALDDITRFEQRQAERLYEALEKLGVLLKAQDNGEKPEGFMQKWNNVAKMRGAITGDLQALRARAARQAAAGETDIQLEFPHYSLFTD